MGSPGSQPTAQMVGALLSSAAGFIGMFVAVRSNVRTAEAAKSAPEASPGEALHVIGRDAVIIGRVAGTNVSDRRIQLQELGGIPGVPVPVLRQGLGAHQVHVLVPGRQDGEKPLQISYL